ncbi:MAG: hypothetical protein HOV86_14085 [Thermoactinospora sp.]|nr:hypothetical protein [Thermoactinospora sp.]
MEPPCNESGVCENPEVTVTITTTLPTPTITPTEVTVTQTVTASPSKSKSPKASKTPTPEPQVQQPTQPPAQQPTQAPIVPTTSEAPEPVLQLPSAEPETAVPSTNTTPSEVSDQVQLEARNAQPEFDQTGLTQKLAIPALVLVLLALFAVLIFEGRLRKMAHAAAVRKAGPQPPQGDGYPAGSGFTGPYQGSPGMAYAPIISLVPVQTYPTVHMPYGPAYHDPAAYGHQGYPDPAAYGHQGYQDPGPHQPQPAPAYYEPVPEPHYEPEPVSDYRDSFEPAVPVSDIPPGGDAPYDDRHAAASAAEHGDGLPWDDSDDSTITYQVPDRTIEEPRPGHDR